MSITLSLCYILFLEMHPQTKASHETEIPYDYTHSLMRVYRGASRDQTCHRSSKLLQVVAAPPVFFSTLAARSHHSQAFSIHSIIYIVHSSPTSSSLQSQDHKPFFSACTSLVKNSSFYSSCSLSYSSILHHTSSSFQSSDSDPRPVLDISRDVFPLAS